MNEYTQNTYRTSDSNSTDCKLVPHIQTNRHSMSNVVDITPIASASQEIS